MKAKYCYWSVCDGAYGAMMEHCVRTARQSGVFKEFHALTDRPLEKFAAAYTMAYGLAYMPNRDLHTMLEKLTEARKWYLQLAGASYESWRYLLMNDALKGVVEVDPEFKPLLTAS